MTSKLIPSNPEDVMVIGDIAPNVTTLSVPFLRFGRIKIGGRATIVRLQTGSLAIFSPVALTPTVLSKLAQLSPNPPITYLIAPDMEHHIFLSQWAQHYPKHHIIAPSPLPEKRAHLNKSDKEVTILEFGTLFDAEKEGKDVGVGGASGVKSPRGKGGVERISEEFDREFEYEYVSAHMNKEIVFLHKPSKTLIQADLIFNLPATEQYSRASDEERKDNIWTRLFGGIQNTRGEAIWQRRFLWYGAKNREYMRESWRRMEKWDFVNVVPSHGDVILGDGKEVFRRVGAWFLEEKK